MIVYLKKNTWNRIVALSGDGEQEQEGNEEHEVTEVEPAKVPSSGTRLKQAQSQAKKKKSSSCHHFLFGCRSY